jgi:membrane protein DedA with SNARE-associated domain
VLDRLLDGLAQLPTVPIYLLLMALSAVENVFPPVPADTAVALGAFLARRGEISVVPLAVLCWLSNTASAAWTYFLARRHGAAFFETGWGRRLLPPTALVALQKAYAKYGVAAIFVSRFLPGVRAAVTPFAGIARMPARRALVPAALASAIWYGFLAAAGYALADNWDAVKALVGSANRALGVVAAVAAVVVFVWLWRRRSAPEERPPLP